MTTEPLTCSAIVRWEPTPFARYQPVYCSQSVGLRHYWANGVGQASDVFVSYCPREGHRENCERRFAPRVEHTHHDFMDADTDCPACERAEARA